MSLKRIERLRRMFERKPMPSVLRVLTDAQLERALDAANAGEDQPEDVRAVLMAQPRDPRFADVTDDQIMNEIMTAYTEENYG